MRKKATYQIVWQQEERTADVYVYGDITSSAQLYRNWGWDEGEVSAGTFKEDLEGLDVDVINVYINSYGGEVAEALAIYSMLKRHNAEVRTYCDGFACSAATIIFCAGTKRVMGPIALMMIHNCMSYLGYANSEEMRKAAEDNDKINQSSIEAYKAVSNLSEDKIKEMMNAETWLTAQECLEYGFATEIAEEEEDDTTQQSAFGLIRNALLQTEPQQPVIDVENMVQRLATMIDSKLDAIQQKAGDPDNLDVPEQTENKSNKFLETLFNNII